MTSEAPPENQKRVSAAAEQRASLMIQATWPCAPASPAGRATPGFCRPPGAPGTWPCDPAATPRWREGPAGAPATLPCGPAAGSGPAVPLSWPGLCCAPWLPLAHCGSAPPPPDARNPWQPAVKWKNTNFISWLLKLKTFYFSYLIKTAQEPEDLHLSRERVHWSVDRVENQAPEGVGRNVLRGKIFSIKILQTNKVKLLFFVLLRLKWQQKNPFNSMI